MPCYLVMVSKTALFGSLIAAMILLSGYAVFAQAEAKPPLQQARNGVPLNEIICSDGHVLMASPSGSPACLFPASVEILQDRGFARVVDMHAAWAVLDPGSPHWNLETIPNPSGYWVPIIDTDGFASRLAGATGDAVLNKDTINSFGTVFKTEQGKISLRDHTIISQFYLDNEAEYTLRTDIGRGDYAAEKEFIKHFMEGMDFEYDREAFEQYDFRLSYNDARSYAILEEHSYIRFLFAGYHAEDVPMILTKHVPGSAELLATQIPDFDISGYVQLRIIFGGWTNDPELVVPTLSGEGAYEAARKYAGMDPDLNRPAEEGGDCEYTLADVGDADLSKRANIKVIFGVPVYVMSRGYCDYEYAPGHSNIPRIIVDGWTGEYAYVIYMRGLD